MKCPETLALIKAELYRRYNAGKSTDMVDMNMKVMSDPPEHSIFARLTILFADGESIDVDTAEFAHLLEKAISGARTH